MSKLAVDDMDLEKQMELLTTAVCDDLNSGDVEHDEVVLDTVEFIMASSDGVRDALWSVYRQRCQEYAEREERAMLARMRAKAHPVGDDE